jgi:hypothetical protein
MFARHTGKRLVASCPLFRCIASNALQQPVLTLANNARQQAGHHEFTVQNHLPNGAYFVRLTAQDSSGRMVRTSVSIMVTK